MLLNVTPEVDSAEREENNNHNNKQLCDVLVCFTHSSFGYCSWEFSLLQSVHMMEGWTLTPPSPPSFSPPLSPPPVSILHPPSPVAEPCAPLQSLVLRLWYGEQTRPSSTSTPLTDLHWTWNTPLIRVRTFYFLSSISILERTQAQTHPIDRRVQKQTINSMKSHEIAFFFRRFCVASFRPFPKSELLDCVSSRLGFNFDSSIHWESVWSWDRGHMTSTVVSQEVWMWTWMNDLSVDFLQLLLFRMVRMLQPRFLSLLLSVQLIFLNWVSKVSILITPCEKVLEMASILDFDGREVNRMSEPETGFIGQECLHRRGIWLQLLKDIQEMSTCFQCVPAGSAPVLWFCLVRCEHPLMS